MKDIDKNSVQNTDTDDSKVDNAQILARLEKLEGDLTDSQRSNESYRKKYKELKTQGAAQTAPTGEVNSANKLNAQKVQKLTDMVTRMESREKFNNIREDIGMSGSTFAKAREEFSNKGIDLTKQNSEVVKALLKDYKSEGKTAATINVNGSTAGAVATQSNAVKPDGSVNWAEVEKNLRKGFNFEVARVSGTPELVYREEGVARKKL